ncbi:tandem-95 repeat protein [Vibrio diazotrophicus]|uniref:tandem-95 repeat protein n=3 Tax=Vibrio diazotrophicus TaxID=685 RepID=UPI00313D4E85
MAKGSLFSIASLAVNQMIVIDKNGDIKIATIGEKLPEGAVIIQRGDEAGFNNEATTQLVDQNNELQDVTDDVAQLLAALEEGQDPTQLDEELAPAAGGSNGSAPTDSASIDRVGSEIIASTNFSTTGFESLGFSQTQSLALINLNRSNSNVITEAADRNSDPKAQNDTISVDEDTSVTIDVLSNDSDKDGDTLTIVSATVPLEQGSVEIVGGKLVFTPAENYNGQTNIEYTISDGQGGLDTAKVTVTVNPVNDAPVAYADSQTTNEDTVLNEQVPEATDVDGTINVNGYALVTGVGEGNGHLVFNPDGSYSFTPGSDFDSLSVGDSREVSFTYTASDNDNGVSEPKTITITVTGTNDIPVAYADSQTTNEDTVLNEQVPEATDVDGTINVNGYALVEGVGEGNGHLVFNPDGSYSFTPGSDFDSLSVGDSREVSFTYTASDNDNGVSEPKTITITVTGTNDIPVAYADSQTTNEDTVLNEQVPEATDVDGTINVNGYALVEGVGEGNGHLVFNPDGSYSFTPGSDFDSLSVGDSREVSFTYTASDNDNGVSEPKTITITVTGTNDIPVAYADSQTTNEDTVLNEQVPEATDVDGTINVNGYALVEGVGEGNGHLVFNPDGSYSFTPGSDFDSLSVGDSREVSFTYTASDNDNGVSEPKTITITVTGTNDIPVAYADSQTTNEDTVLNEQVPEATDVDGTINVNGYALVEGVGEGNGHLVFNPDGSYSFTPGSDFDSLSVGDSREVSFTYTASDNDNGVSEPKTITITVTGTNDIPVAYADSQTTNEDTVLNEQVPEATDVDGTINVNGYALVEGVGEGNGHLVFNPDGSYSFTPGSDFDSLSVGDSREVSFTYTASDNDNGVSEPKTITITVTGTNDIPVAYADSQTTNEDTVLNEQVPEATDVDGTINVNGYALVEGVGEGNGHLVFNPDGSYSFTPGSDFDSLSVGDSREVSFTYTASDNDNGVSEPKTITITVTGTNDIPVAYADSQTTNEDTVLNEQVPEATDVDGTINVNGYALVEGVGEGNGHLVFNPDGSYSFTPGSDFDSLSVGDSREVSFTYTASDNDNGVSEPKTITITVTGTNDIPVAYADSQTTNEDTVLNEQVPEATDVDGTINVNGYALVEGVGEGNGHLVFNPDGSYSFTPGSDFDSLSVGDSREVSFTYTASDNDNGVSEPKTITITVTGTNDIPVAYADSQTTNEDTVLNEQVPEATDVDGTINVNGYALVEGVGEGNGHLVFNPDGSYSFTPGSDFDSLSVGDSREVSFTYTASDNDNGVSEPKTITITVTGTNDIPVAYADSQTTNEDTVLNEQVPEATDVDGTINVNGYALVEGVGEGNGHLVFNPDGSYSFTPGSDFDSLSVGDSREVSFTYTASDNDNGVSEPKTITITVTGTNDVPIAVDDIYSSSQETVLFTESFEEMVSLSSGRWTILSNEELEATSAWQSSRGLEIQTDGVVTNASDGNYYAELDANVNTSIKTTIDTTGQDSVRVEFDYNPRHDGNSSSNMTFAVGTVLVFVSADGTVSASHDGVSVAIQGPDNNGWYHISGTFPISEDGSTDLILSGSGKSDSYGALVDNIVVTGVIDADLVTTEDTALTIDVAELLANDSDPDGDAISITSVSATSQHNGTVTLVNGTIVYQPNSNFSGVDSFTYTISDGKGGVDTATVTVKVTPENDSPVTESDVSLVNEGSTISVEQSVLLNDSDADKDSLTVVGVAKDSSGNGEVTADPDDGSFTIVTSLGGIVVMQSNGTYTYTAPVLDHSNSETIQDSFTYLASDGVDTSAWTTVTVDVVDTGITAIDDYAEIAEDTNSVVGNVLTNDLQPDTDPDAVVTSVTYNGEKHSMPESGVLTIDAETGTLVINSNGSYTFVAAESKPSTISIAPKDLSDSSVVLVYGTKSSQSLIDSDGKIVQYSESLKNNVTSTSGLGVSSKSNNHGDSQIDVGESLIVKFNSSVSAAIFDLINVQQGNSKGTDGSILITVYDSSGKVDSSATISFTDNDTVVVTGDDIGYVVFGASDSDTKYRLGDNIEVTYENNNTAEEVFTYTVKDGDGDSSSAQLTINGIDTVNETPEITFSSGTDNVVVSEEGLSALNANPDSEGTPDTTNDSIAQGTFSVSDVDTDSSDLSVSLTAPDVALYSNNVAIEWSTENGNLVGKAGNETILVISLSQDSSNPSSYSYTVTLLGSLDHADKTAEDTLSFDVGVEVSDGTNTVKDSITVTVEDDSPDVPVNIVVNAVEHNETTTVSLGEFNFTQRPNDSGCHNNNAYTFADTNSGNSVFVYAVGLPGTYHHEELTFSNNSGMGVKSSSVSGMINDRTDSEIDYQYGNSEKIVMKLGDKVAYGMQVSLAEFYSNEGEKGKIIFLLEGKVVQEEDLIATHSNGSYSASFNVASGFDEVRFEAVTNGNGWCSDNSDYSIKSVSFESLIVDPVIATDEGTITADFGADGAGVITLTGVADTNIKTADGLPVTLGSTDVVDGVKTQVWVDSHGDKVFEIELNSSTGEWSYRQFAELAEGDSVEITYDVVDADGDIVSSTSPNTGTDNDFTSGLKGEFYNVGYQLGTIAQAVYVTEHQNANATFTSSEISYIGQDWDDLGDYDWRNESTNLESWLGDDAQSVEFKNKTDSNDAVVRLTGGVALDAGTYSIKVNADDGYRIIIDGHTVASFDSNTPVRSEEFTFSVDENGIHQIEVIYWDQGGAYVLEVSLNDGSGYELLGSEAYPTYSGYNVEITDYVNSVGTSNNDHLVGTAANDHIQGLGAQDHLSGDAGDDWLEGGEGDDHLIGGSGKDILDGGSGQDSLAGGSGDDKLYGQQGDDLLSGESGSDYLEGGQGQDYLYGGLGNDILVGGDGDDVLIGGNGHDQLTGGSGSDVFVIEGSNSSDTIMDFNIQEDIVDISELLNIDSSSDHDAIQAYLDSESSSLSITANGDGSATISVADQNHAIHSAGSFGADSHIVSGDIVSVLFNNQEYTLKVD